MKNRFPYFALIVAFILRLVLFHMNVSESLQVVQLTTPFSSLTRVKEGLFLARMGDTLSPYSGSVCHESPLMLMILSPFLSFRSQWPLYILFSALDLLVSCLLFFIASKWQFIEAQSSDATSSGNKGDDDIETRATTFQPSTVALLHAFSPVALISCLAMSPSTQFHSAFAVLALSMALARKPVLAAVSLAFAAHLNFFYSLTLVASLSLLAASSTAAAAAAADSASSGKRSKPSATATLSSRLVRDFLLTVFFTVAILGLCAALMAPSAEQLFSHSATWIHRVYGDYLWVVDLTPNIGLFWYFFIEVFAEFATFYKLVLHYHVFIYVVPLYIRLRQHPMLVTWLLLTIMATFKAYPTLGDHTPHLALIPLVWRAVSGVRFALLLFVVAAILSILSPVFYHLWIVDRSGNANFFYATTLIFALSLVHLMVDAVSRQLTIDFLKKEQNKKKQ